MHFVAFGQYEGSNSLSPFGGSELASWVAAAAVPSLFVVAGRSGGFVRGSGRFTGSWCKGVLWTWKVLGGGKAEKKKTRNADQIRGAKAVGRRRVLCRGKGEKKRNEKTFMYIPSGFLSLLAWLAVSRGRRFGNRKGRKRQEEQEQSKTRTTKKMKSRKPMCYKLLCHKRFGNRKLYQRLCETMSLKFVAVKRGKTKN